MSLSRFVVISKQKRPTNIKNMPIEKMNVNRMDAIDYFESVKDESKVNLLKYNTNTFITLYKLIYWKLEV